MWLCTAASYCFETHEVMKLARYFQWILSITLICGLFVLFLHVVDRYFIFCMYNLYFFLEVEGILYN